MNILLHSKGRMDASVPRSKRLLTDARSNVFVYMTGHGGNEFLKFQDNEEISAFDIADAFEQMWQKKRYVFHPKTPYISSLYVYFSPLNRKCKTDVCEDITNSYSWLIPVKPIPCTPRSTRPMSLPQGPPN